MNRPPFCTLRLAALAAATLLGSANTPAGTSWGLYQADAAHTGYVALSLSPLKFKPAWQVQLSGLPLSPAVVGQGQVYVSAIGYFTAQTLFALQGDSGQMRWSHEFSNLFAINPPSYANGRVYLQTGNAGSDSYLRAFDALSGAQLFQSPHGAQWERYYAPTVYEQSVYVNAGSYGGLYAFDKRSGATRWVQDLPQYDQWTPAVDARYAYAYVGEYSPGLYVFDRQSGQLAFKIADPNFSWNGWSMNQAPVLGGMNDVYAIQAGRLLSFNTALRKTVWNKTGATYTGQPALANGVVYAYRNGVIVALVQPTGEPLWYWAAPTGALSSNIVLTDTHAFVGTASSTYCLDLRTHASVWSIPVAGALAVGANHLFISGSDGRLTAVRLGS